MERAHRTIKTALKAKGGEWLQQLPVVLLGMRAIPLESGASPFIIVTGSTLLLPKVNQSKLTDGDFIKTLVRSMTEVDFRSLSEGRIHGPQKSFEPRQLRMASHVWLRLDRVRKPLEAPYTGPFEVAEWRDKVVKLKKLDGSVEVVSVDRVKPAVLKSSPVRQLKQHQPQVPQATDQSQVPQAPDKPSASDRRTHCGRRVRFSKKLQTFFC